MPDKNVYTVTELNHAARKLLENEFQQIAVIGEISNFVRPASGHWYFSLKDNKAQIRCAMFRSSNQKVSFAVTEGMQLKAYAKVSLYAPRGDYQLIIESIEVAGDGALRRAFEQLKQQLAQQGLFAEKHKQALPSLPNTIGVITSSTGAAIRDIIKVLRRRCPLIPIIIYPTLVQGKQAATEIAQMIKRANARRECDVLIVGRGGGSMEDLSAFNDAVVAHAIYDSKLPIISAVGHEIDITIADLVADQRAATPSAAAELVSPDMTEWLNYLANLNQRLRRQLLQQLQQKQQYFVWLNKRLRHPGQNLQEQAQQLDYLWQTLLKAQQYYLSTQQQTLLNLSRALNAVSPLATLDRGYAILKKANTVVTSTKQLRKNDIISARLHNGTINCTVNRVKNS